MNDFYIIFKWSLLTIKTHIYSRIFIEETTEHHKSELIMEIKTLCVFEDRVNLSNDKG